MYAMKPLPAILWPSKAPGSVINGLKREDLIAMNSIILHEIYFKGLGATDRTPSLGEELTRDFGGVRR